MLQDRPGQVLDVVGHHVLASGGRGQGSGGPLESERGPRRHAQRQGGVVTGGRGQIHDVALEGHGHVHLRGEGHHGRDGVGAGYGAADSSTDVLDSGRSSIAISACRSGYPIRTRSRNRSSWLSGRG